MEGKRKQLAKFVIHSFSDKKFMKEVKDAKFTIPINPESFNKKNIVELDTRRGHGSSGSSPKYKSTAPEEFKIDFVLDGTATLEGYFKEYKKLSVSDQLKKFLNCTYYLDGTIHRPRFLLIFWGKEIKFPCVLSNLDINYTLFNPDGSPLRVKISATFLSYLTDDSRLAKDRLRSADLTHYRKVKQGDRLDLMTFDIYNDTRYLMQIADVNNLSNFRRLTVSQNLNFPPFDKRK